MALQSFAPAGGLQEITVPLKPQQVALKHTMRAAYASQTDMLAPFQMETERFRAAPQYDFRLPANGGRLLYERFPWGLNGAEWRNIVASTRERTGGRQQR